MELSKRALGLKASSTLAISAKAKQMVSEGHDLCSFTVGEPDFDTPQPVKDAAILAIEQGFTKYTDASGIMPLRQAICKKLKEENGLEYTPAQILVSNGAKHCLNNIFAAILNEGDEVIIPVPYWLSYSAIVELFGGVCVFVPTKPENAYKMTAEEFEAAITPKTKAVLINTPNNPTGSVYSAEELKALADVAVKHETIVISDEIYEHLIYDEGVSHVSIASFGKEIFDLTIVINGFSKSHSMTGWRVGYSAAPPAIAKVMSNIQSHCTSNINSMTQKAALAALSEHESIEAMRQEFAKRRDYIYDRLLEIPLLTAPKPAGAFYLFVDCTKTYGMTIGGKLINTAADLADVMLDRAGVVVVPCADFGAPDHIRLSYPMSMAEIEKGMDRIKALLA